MPVCCGLFDSPVLYLNKCSEEWRLQHKPLDEFASHLREMVESEFSKANSAVAPFRPAAWDPTPPKPEMQSLTTNEDCLAATSNRIVTLRGFIGDMLNPEFFPARYRVTSASKPGTHEWLLGMFTEEVKLPDGFELDLDDSDSTTLERYCFCVGPIPGESRWVLDTLKSGGAEKEAGLDAGVLGDCGKAIKRPIESISCESGDRVTNGYRCDSNAIAAMECDHEGPSEPKRADNESLDGTKIVSPSANDAHCLPASTSSYSPIIAKFYEDPQLKLNDMVELCGLVFPGVSHADDAANMVGSKRPPLSNPSLCFHVLHYRQLVHSNPLLDLALKPFSLNGLPSMASIKESLLAYLSQCLSGDCLAAEYLLLHFISKVHTRRDLLAVGKFSLNLFNVPISGKFCQNLCDLIPLLISKTKIIPMTLRNLNELRFVPKKDFSANRLVPGELQLCPGTELVLDETKLEVGQLQERGLYNLAALKKLIGHQKVDYDFQFHSVEFLTDFNIFVISEGKSLLDCDFSLPMNFATGSVDSSFQPPPVSEECLSQFRAYLTIARESAYSIGETMQSIVQQDFVAMRQEERQVSGENLHHLLVLARLLSIASGGDTLTAASWQRAKVLEALRAARIKDVETEMERRRQAAHAR